MPAPQILAVGLVLSSALMLIVWRVSAKIGNSGLVDPAWAGLTAGLAVMDAVAGQGWIPRRVVVGGALGLWGSRLAWHLLRRVVGQPEDPRYAALRRQWGAAARVRTFRFFQIQGLAAVFFALPSLLASGDPAPRFSPLEIVAAALAAIALAGEAAADRQLAAFKARPTNRGRTCRAGLWRYSRHPNYFFEWLFWVAVALFAAGAPFGLLALACPAAMLYFLFRVTGIPLAEAQALATRGDDYREYQAVTPVFWPGPPRDKTASTDARNRGREHSGT